MTSPATSPPSALELRDVSHRIGRKTLLERVSARFPAGQLSVVLGPNGAGKSTLLKVLLGWLRPQAGAVYLEDTPLVRLHPLERARALGYLAQGEPLPEALRVRELVALGLPPRRTWLGGWLPHPLEGSTEDDERAVTRAMEHTHVLEFADRQVGALSGGERQRVALARALAAQPRWLLLDEPTNYLDPAHGAELLRLLKAQVARGTGVIMVLHDLNLALEADCAVLLNQGRVAVQGALENVLTPHHIADVYGLKVERLSVGSRHLIVPAQTTG